MQREYQGRLGRFLVAATFATLPAHAEPTSSGSVRFELEPGEFKTIFASKLPETSSLPVFRICLSSPNGYGAIVYASPSATGTQLGGLEPARGSECMFASASSLSVGLDTELSPGTVAQRQDATVRAKAWLADRIESLRGKENRTEADDMLLQEFEARMESVESVQLKELKRLEAKKRLDTLEAKPQPTPAEQAERSDLKMTLNRLNASAAIVTVTPVPF